MIKKGEAGRGFTKQRDGKERKKWKKKKMNE